MVHPGQELTFSTYNAGIHYACSLALYAGVTNMRSTVGQSELVVLLGKLSTVQKMCINYLKSYDLFVRISRSLKSSLFKSN